MAPPQFCWPIKIVLTKDTYLISIWEATRSYLMHMHNRANLHTKEELFTLSTKLTFFWQKWDDKCHFVWQKLDVALFSTTFTFVRRNWMFSIPNDFRWTKANFVEHKSKRAISRYVDALYASSKSVLINNDDNGIVTNIFRTYCFSYYGSQL